MEMNKQKTEALWYCGDKGKIRLKYEGCELGTICIHQSQGRVKNSAHSCISEF